MSRQPTLSNTIHLRDFVDIVTDGPTRSNTSYVEIQTELNIFEEDQFYSPQVVVEPIRTRIHAYMKPEECELYVSDAFIYVDGRFSTAQADDDTLEIIVQAFRVMRHPGDSTDFDKYRQHLPEQWCPMVTIIDSVRTPAEVLLDLTDLRHFTLETSVYDTSKAAPIQFEVTCFLENTKRWQRFKTPPAGSFLSITAKVVGRTTETNHLALRVFDLAYLPRPGSAAAAPTPATTPSKRANRWDSRAVSTTPSKKPHTEPDQDTRGFSDPPPIAKEPLRTPPPTSELGV